MIIDIGDVEFRNFMSYGDYVTKVDLTNLKSCLINGENGSGKSGLTNSILWALSGKTMHSAAPGDKVINYNAKDNCYSTLTLKNNDKIQRTRKGKDGHDELIYLESGIDVSLGTPKMQQAELNRKLSFDYTIFCGSVFCSQYNKPWLEMSDQTRKQAIEREFHLDRIQLYAEVAKEHKEEIESKQEKLRISHNNVVSNQKSAESELAQIEKYADSFETNRQAKIKSIQEAIDGLQNEFDATKEVDVAKIENNWNLYAKAEDVLDKQSSAINNIAIEIGSLEIDINRKIQYISKWASKVGICKECEQPIEDSYVKGKTGTLETEIEQGKLKLKELKAKQAAETAKLQQNRQKLNKLKPVMTITEAKSNNKHRQNIQKSIEQQQKLIEQTNAQTNDYITHAEKLKEKIGTLEKTAADIIDKMKDYDAEILHWSYLYKTYSDRRKIKAQILSEFVPYLNDRIAYYLVKRMDMQLVVEFTDGLGVKSNYWGYDFFCGGERKRVDLSIMFAMYDLHELMYGKQCNIMVLDEVDSRLDHKGVQAMIDIIRTDLEPKLDSILVISHRHDMKGAMASEIIVEKDGPAPTGVSRIKEIKI